MLAKSYKLTGKDVRFLLRKRGLVYGQGMVFAIYQQYENRSYNQRSLQVSTKISKSSVHRNFIKRLFYEQLAEDLPVEKKIGEGYYKIFVYFHKTLPEELAKLLANPDKNAIKSQIKARFHEHFNSFPALVCRFCDSSKKLVTPLKRKPTTGNPSRKKS